MGMRPGETAVYNLLEKGSMTAAAIAEKLKIERAEADKRIRRLMDNAYIEAPATDAAAEELLYCRAGYEAKLVS